MSARPLSVPTWPRLWTGILGALVVSLAFFPIYVGGTDDHGRTRPAAASLRRL